MLLALSTAEMLLLVGLGLASLFIVRNWLVSSTQRKEADPAQARPAIAARTSHDHARMEAPPDFLRWQVEMHDTARELKAELDSKLSGLSALVRIAQEERERLEATLARAQSAEPQCSRSSFALVDRLATASTPEEFAAIMEAIPPESAG